MAKGCEYLEETNNSNGQDFDCCHPKYNGDCDHCPLGGLKAKREWQKEQRKRHVKNLQKAIPSKVT